MLGGAPIISPSQITDKHARRFLERHCDLCAASRFNWRQITFFVLSLLTLLLAFNRDFKIAFTALTFTLCAFYGVLIFFRLVSVILALVRVSEHRVQAEELAELTDAELPIYTVLVPMYKEPEVAQKIVHAVASLDYPQDKLDVKLLLEEDDPETRAKINELGARKPACVEVVIAPKVPKTEPKTKPRACNWGLETARGEFLVIFDAEDQPEPDQLKKAVAVFRRLEAAGKGHVACLQAKLNYFNADQNWLTRFFTLEYTNWFDLFLPGLHAVRTPIPLGGTSNHFRTEVLQQVGGWDPFNVTEDCDLGIRLARQGFATEVLDSTTWEEANSYLPSWIRQRSRWVKGYFQTHLVHTRDSFLPPLLLAALLFWLGTTHEAEPGSASEQFASWIYSLKVACYGLAGMALICSGWSLFRTIVRQRRRFGERALSPWKALSFRFTVGGLSAMLILNLFFWAMTSAYLARKPLARALPESVAQIRVGENTNLYKALNEWTLYHTEVREELYTGATVWNTLWRYLNGTLKWPEACDHWAFIDDWSMISQLFFPIAVMLFVANFVFVLLGVISCHKRGLWRLLPYALLMPLYWILISIAALKGLAGLFYDPWHWHKTQHGLSSAHPKPPSPPVSTEAVSAGN